MWAALAEVGVDMTDVAAQLEREGVSSFEKAFDELITALETKASELRLTRDHVSAPVDAGRRCRG